MCCAAVYLEFVKTVLVHQWTGNCHIEQELPKDSLQWHNIGKAFIFTWKLYKLFITLMFQSAIIRYLDKQQAAKDITKVSFMVFQRAIVSLMCLQYLFFNRSHEIFLELLICLVWKSATFYLKISNLLKLGTF